MKVHGPIIDVFHQTRRVGRPYTASRWVPTFGAVSDRVLARDGLDDLLSTVAALGYKVIAPTVRDNSIVYDQIGSTDELPEGWTDLQEGGEYRLERREDDALFGYAVGPSSWKRYLFPPHVQLLRIRRQDGSLAFERSEGEPERLAFVGVRACELAAIAIQDKVFLDSGAVDRTYQSKRDNILLIAVNCGSPSGTCFCVSMGTGPECTSGFDLVVTEVIGSEAIEYVVESGSDTGAEILAHLGGRESTEADKENVCAVIATAEGSMGRMMEQDGLHDLLIDNRHHPRWDEVATRCLTCANCTLVCPTCFCSTTSDTVGFDDVAVRERHWDSCFSLDFSGLHGHPVRASVKSRYRQWMTHKLATWHDQFGMSGCVGCGRCITWCPVGIDITAEVAAMRVEV